MLKRNLLPCLLACVVAVCGYSNDASAQDSFTDGHGDIGIEYDAAEQELELHWHIEGGTVNDTFYDDQEFEADEVQAITNLLFFNTTTGDPIGRPDGAAWDGIGNNAGDFFWVLPQGDRAGTPFLGLASEEMGDPTDWSNDGVGAITWEVSNWSGPGEFSIFQFGSTAPNFFISTANDDLSFNFDVGGHDHFNYSFTELGTYDIEFTVTATHDTAGEISDTANFRFVAVPEPSSALILGALGLVGMVSRRRQTL